MDVIDKIIKENEQRYARLHAPFDPLTGEGAPFKRVLLEIEDYPVRCQWVPERMMKVRIVREIAEVGSIEAYMRKYFDDEECTIANKCAIIDKIAKVRCRYDFCFWAYMNAKIKPKRGGDFIYFKLNYPQRLLLEDLEDMRMNGKPIREIVLKARQWGGSTLTEMYIGWLILVVCKGLNSLIVAHEKTASAEVRDMFDNMLKLYPKEMLSDEIVDISEDKSMTGVSGTPNIKYIPSRNSKIKIGTAERPDSARGGDSALVHLTEVAFWKKTEGKTPEDLIRSATSGALLKENTLIVYESTANGTGNFFHREYLAAKRGESNFRAIFIAWFQIEMYELDIEDIRAFARKLYEERTSERVEDDRHESGKYLWYLWERGATLQGINWYIQKRTEYNNHGSMAAEFPSDDVEAFVHSGARVFDKYKVEELRKTCKIPRYVGDVQADDRESVTNVRFVEDSQGLMDVWSLPEPDEGDERITNRYLVVVDVGGRGTRADWSVIAVFDRFWMIDGGKPMIVAQWRGHIDMDLLAWKSAQIATLYNNALLVIESNTLETKDPNRVVDGDQTEFILDRIKREYDNLYARKAPSENIVDSAETKYGFHTNSLTKPTIISTLIECIRENLYIERDSRACDEYLNYERKPKGDYGAIDGEHDDILMTRAIGLYISLRKMPLPQIVKINTQHSPIVNASGGVAKI